MATTGDDGGTSGLDSGQLILVSICLFGLVAAAFLAPVAGANSLIGGCSGENGAGPSDQGWRCSGGGSGQSGGDSGSESGGDSGSESGGESTESGGDERGERGTAEIGTPDGGRSERTGERGRRGAEGDDTRWVTDEDGNRWRVEENGTRWVNEQNGTRRVVRNNGTRWVVEENGTRWVAEGNDTRWVAERNSTRWVVDRNGTRWVVARNGTRWVTHRNGTRWVIHRNGTRWVTDRNGTRWVPEENGTRWVTERNGTRWVTHRNGTRWVVDRNGTRRILDENGTKWVAEENGTRRILDENATRWFADRNETRWPPDETARRRFPGRNDTRWPPAENDTRRRVENTSRSPDDRTPQVRPPQTGCVAVVSGTPKPGTETTVRVTVDTRPVSGVRVWFNDRFVGRTGDDGAVTGTVPFVTDLNVTVESPTDEPCRFPRRGNGPDEESTIGSGAAATAGVAGVPHRVRAGQVGQSGDRTGVNNTTRYDLPSKVNITVIGEATPGSTVTLDATVSGVPIPDASVAVDGSQVGRTDENGRYELTVPDREQVEVTVSRGELRGTTTIDVPQLSVRFAPRLVVPGERATVSVTRGDEPAQNATVTRGGQTVGTTGPNGTVAFALPLSVSGTVEATAGPQSATTPLWLAYWLTIGVSLVLALLTVVTTAITARLRGRRAAKRVAVGWAGIWTLYVGYVVGEQVGLAVAAAAIALVALYRHRQAVASGSGTAAGLLAGFLQWCSRAVLWVVAALESLADWAGAAAVRLAAWLRTLPTSLSGLAARLGAWLRAVPARLVSVMRSLPLRAVAAVVGAIAVVAAATFALGGRGFLLSTVLVLLAAVGWWLSRRGSSTPSEGESDDATAATGRAARERSVPTLRKLWRRLASWVLPGTWRTKTPAEVSQAAVERGFPRGPVETLTEAFREVEYGGQPEERRQAQAETAFEAVERARDTEGEGEQ